MTRIYGQEVPYAIVDVVEDLPKVDEMLAVVCTGTGIGLVAFMTGYYLQKQPLNYRDLGEICSLTMLSDPIVDEETGYFDTPGVKLRFTTSGRVPMLLAFGPRQPAAWEAHFAGSALFDVILKISRRPIILSVGGYGVPSKEKMPDVVGRPNCAVAEEFMRANKIPKIDEIQKAEGIGKILNAGQGFQAALPMLAIRRKVPAVFFLGTALMPEHFVVRMDPQAVRHVMLKISELVGFNLDGKEIEESISRETTRETSREQAQQRAIYELARRFSFDEGPELPDSNMYI